MIIIGILAAIAIPVFLSQRQRAQTASCESDARNGAAAAIAYATDNQGSYAGMTLDILDNAPTDTPRGYDWNYGAGSGTFTVTVPNANSYTIGITCNSGRTVTFNSGTGSITTT